MLMEKTPNTTEVKPHLHRLAALQDRAIDDCKSLVQRIRAGDPAAEHLLVKRYQPHIEHLGRTLGADPVLRQDLVQEVMLKVILNLRNDQLKDAGKLRAYINQTTRFTYYGWIRNKNSQLEYQATCDTEAGDADNAVEDSLEQARNRAWLAEQIDKLNQPRDRQLLMRFYLDHRDKCDVCAELNLTDTNFDKLIFRAKQRLKKVADV